MSTFFLISSDRDTSAKTFVLNNATLNVLSEMKVVHKPQLIVELSDKPLDDRSAGIFCTSAGSFSSVDLMGSTGSSITSVSFRKLSASISSIIKSFLFAT